MMRRPVPHLATVAKIPWRGVIGGRLVSTPDFVFTAAEITGEAGPLGTAHA